ncbi:CRISPR-associated helicase Cas3' [Niallia sp. Sow4_A1]|uniref:CRISPR-associated helicase Cas3' n=1 Tax=Niallia sp. Sow4_A1 TaxID=3438793 RepID=UPI003F9A4D7D
MEFIAHIRERDGEIQSVEEHLLAVKQIAESIGMKMGVPHIAGLAGMLHDLGKYTKEFRNYIWTAVNDPKNAQRKGSVDHSTAGGKLLYEMYHKDKKTSIFSLLAEIVGNAIISHHSYLKDYIDLELNSEFLKRVRKSDLLEFSLSKEQFFEKVIKQAEFKQYVNHAAQELQDFLKKDKNISNEEKCMFLTKYIFSALVDGDRTNTRLFEENKNYQPVENHNELFQEYYKKVLEKIDNFKNSNNNNSPINILRKEMSEQCDQFGERPDGIYTLSIPTGGGKTLASLRYALKHAILHNKKHIIYIVPFTTIIEQNAEEVRKILNDNANILEHHSNLIEDNYDDENEDGIMGANQKLKLAKDNWDSPIIFTTMVQFLNVFYANGTRNIRRMHNLAESVIIFDEVQKVPTSCVSLFNHALNFLKSYGQSSIVLCTATQPALDFVEHKLAINKDAEIISQMEEVIEAFKRVNIIDLASEHSFDNVRLASFIEERLVDITSMLVILNTKTVVKKLYELLKVKRLDIPIYHLSTSMCPFHRKEILEEVRELLEQKRKVICISTQLIEAGVDVSFECVIRSLAGLDSIAQAAGRCNRHGEMGIKQVYVVDHIEENLDKLPEIKIGKVEARTVFKEIDKNPESFGGNILSEKAMNRYFQGFYQQFATKLNYSLPQYNTNLIDLLMAGRNKNGQLKGYNATSKEKFSLMLSNSYGTAAKHFEVIDQVTTTVLVPHKEGEEIIADLNGNHSIEDLGGSLRRAQQFSINIFSYEKEQLIKSDGLVYYFEGKITVLKEGFYNEEYGLDLSGESGYSFLQF